MTEATFSGPSQESPAGVPAAAAKICTECGCVAKRITKGKCNACYLRAWRGPLVRTWPLLDPEIEACLLPVADTSPTFARRVFSYIDASGDCWEWTGTPRNNGYGAINRGSNDAGDILAHRAVWELLVGPIPDGMHYDHLCRNRSCVNPDHGEIVTPEENKRRGYSPAALNSRREVCDTGHPLDGKKARGGRYCKTCNRDGERRRRLAAKDNAA